MRSYETRDLADDGHYNRNPDCEHNARRAHNGDRKWLCDEHNEQKRECQQEGGCPCLTTAGVVKTIEAALPSRVLGVRQTCRIEFDPNVAGAMKHAAP